MSTPLDILKSLASWSVSQLAVGATKAFVDRIASRAMELSKQGTWAKANEDEKNTWRSYTSAVLVALSAEGVVPLQKVAKRGRKR